MLIFAKKQIMDDEAMGINQEQIFEQLQQFLNNFSGELNILEEQIDVHVQLEYFKYTAEVKTNNDIEELLSQSSILKNNEVDIHKKRELLCRLASVEDVRAYRVIESHLSEIKGSELYNWCRLALEESKMLMHTKLLDQKQLFISTGLGGKQNKLRYFIVLLSNNQLLINDFQQKIVEKEFKYVFEKQGAEIEDIEHKGNYITMLVLIPVQILLTDLFSKAIAECNEFGNFLKRDCIITNVKPLNEDEIYQIINHPNEENQIEDLKPPF